MSNKSESAPKASKPAKPKAETTNAAAGDGTPIVARTRSVGKLLIEMEVDIGSTISESIARALPSETEAKHVPYKTWEMVPDQPSSGHKSVAEAKRWLKDNASAIGITQPARFRLIRDVETFTAKIVQAVELEG